MPCFEKPVAQPVFRVAVLVAVALLVTSCSESKVSQCSKLIEIANRAVLGVKQVSASPQPDSSIQQMNAIADVANTAKAEMQAVRLVDEQLQDYQTRFVDMYTETNQATRDLVSAAEAKDAQAAQQAFTALQAATAKEEPLVTEVNDYCGVPSSPSASPSPTASPSP